MYVIWCGQGDGEYGVAADLGTAKTALEIIIMENGYSTVGYGWHHNVELNRWEYHTPESVEKGFSTREGDIQEVRHFTPVRKENDLWKVTSPEGEINWCVETVEKDSAIYFEFQTELEAHELCQCLNRLRATFDFT